MDTSTVPSVIPADEEYGKVLLSFGPNGMAVVSKNKRSNLFEFHELGFSHSVDGRFMKNFIVSSSEIFCAVQKQFEALYPRTVPQSKIAIMSRRYRAVLMELVKSFEDAKDESAAVLYYNLNFVWSFCEVMFISSNPELPVIPYFMEWIHENFDDSKVVISNLEESFAEVDSQVMKKMWNVIFKLVSHGKTKEAAKHLKFMNPENSAAFHEQIESISELLVKKPVYSPALHSVTNFDKAWKAWQYELSNRVNHKLYSGSKELTLIANIMLGDDTAFESLLSLGLIPTWYEYLGMMLTYKYTTVTPDHLKALASVALEEYGLSDITALTPLERILLEAMDYNIIGVLRDMQLHWNHPWFTLHFADLVFCGGRFTTSEDLQLVSSSLGLLRDEFLMDYGITLMQHSSMWQVGIKYLTAIPERGGWPVIKECIKRKQASSDFETQKIISVAERFGFSEEVHDICKVRALKKLRDGRKQDALLWSVKAGDGPLMTHILDSILLDENYDIEQSLLESIRNSMPNADRLWFLSGFCEFRKLMARHDYKNAVSQLCQLIKENLIPTRMAAKVALNIQHFQNREAVLESWQVSLLMQYLHTKVDVDEIGEEMFRTLNSVLLCNRADVAVKNLKKARQVVV